MISNYCFSFVSNTQWNTHKHTIFPSHPWWMCHPLKDISAIHLKWMHRYNCWHQFIPQKSPSQWCKCVAFNKGCDSYGYKFSLWRARVTASSYLDIKQDFSAVQSKGTGKRRHSAWLHRLQQVRSLLLQRMKILYASCVSGRSWVHLGNIKLHGA